MTAAGAIGPGDREAALGRLFRGIAHETANSLNAILMNAQLGMLSADEAPSSLETIADQARGGGRFLKLISTFAGASDLAPQDNGSVSECLGLARKLIGSRVRRSGLKLTIEASDTPPIPLNPFAAAITIALLIDAACATGAAQATIVTSVTDHDCEVRLSMDNAAPAEDAAAATLAYRFARQLAADHGGRFERETGGWVLALPRGS